MRMLYSVSPSLPRRTRRRPKPMLKSSTRILNRRATIKWPHSCATTSALRMSSNVTSCHMLANEITRYSLRLRLRAREPGGGSRPSVSRENLFERWAAGCIMLVHAALHDARYVREADIPLQEQRNGCFVGRIHY